MQRERIKSISVKREAVDDFTRYSDNYFPTTNYLAGCNAWWVGACSPVFWFIEVLAFRYRRGDHVVGIYPGSVLHAKKALEYREWSPTSRRFQNWLANYIYYYYCQPDGKTTNLPIKTDDLDILATAGLLLKGMEEKLQNMSGMWICRKVRRAYHLIHFVATSDSLVFSAWRAGIRWLLASTTGCCANASNWRTCRRLCLMMLQQMQIIFWMLAFS